MSGTTDLSHARIFLDKVLPWPKDPARDAYLNIHWRSMSQDGKTFWGGRATKSIDEMVGWLGWTQRQPDIKDTYVCMSSQSRAEERVSKAGKKYLNAIRFQDAVVELKSIFTDIDVKPGAYASTQDALVALKKFLTDAQIPPPTIVVGSGSGGFHVHWVLDTSITPDRWQVLSYALVRATKQHGLMCDTQCTIDSARILRVPGTMNNKSDPKAVTLMSLGNEYTLAAMEAALAPYVKSEDVPITAPALDDSLFPQLPVTDAGKELSAGIEGGEAKLIDIQDVAANCGFIADALATGGATYSNPLWFLSTSVATFLNDGRTQAHAMASKHPGYNPATTDDLYDRLLKARQDRDIGWPKCDKIEMSGCTSCGSCQFKSQAKSPLNHARQANPATPSTTSVTPTTSATSTAIHTKDPLPPGYLRDANGIVYQRIIMEDGSTKDVQLSPYPMLDAWLQDQPTWTLNFTTTLNNGRNYHVSINADEAGSRDTMVRVLARQGVMVRSKAAPFLSEFIVAWITKLQNTKDAVVINSPFGWTVENGKLVGFTYAGRVWMPTGDKPAPAPDPVLARQYMPKGDLAPWKAVAKVVTDQRRPELDAIIAASFGAPLVRFTGHSGVMLSAYSSESGIGKSTAMSIGQSVWGNPKSAMQTLNDTANSVLNKLGLITNLPLYWDELKTDSDIEGFVRLAFQLTQGKEKSRLSHDSKLKEVGVWQTMLVSAANDSLRDSMDRIAKATTAGGYRLFEYVVTPAANPGPHSQGYVSRLLGDLSDNYGAAGLEYAKFLGSNFDRVAKGVAEIQDQLTDELAMHQMERFWQTTMTVVLAGAKYANELGLTDIDEVGLKDFLVTLLGKMRAEIQDSTADMKNQTSVSNILAQFLKAMHTRHTLFTNKIVIGQGKPQPGVIQVLGDPSKLDGVCVQIARDDRILRISSTYMSRWLHDHDFPRHSFTKALKDEFGMTSIKARLGSGTPFVSPLEYILELDMNDPTLVGFIE